MTQRFHHIILMGRAGVSGVPETLSSLYEFLSRRDLRISVEEQTAAIIPHLTLPMVIPQQLPSDGDLIIVVGGDGSLLNAAHIAVQHDIPVLGINRGRLGFLTDIRPDEIEKISEVLEGNFQQEFRFLLEADLRYLDDQIEHQIALNDVVLLPGDLAQMIEFEIRINNQFVYKQRADGLIVATPTGSTAYALSGGGPILHPHLEAMVLVPMFPHTLTSRPLVVDAQSQIELIITPNNETSPYVSSDGHGRCPIPPGGKVCIRKYKKRLQLIHPIDYNYYRTLREKLGWHQHSRE